MTPDELLRELRGFLASNPSDLVITIPEGSGIFRISDVAPAEWKPFYMSIEPGRWTKAGQQSKCFADDFQRCMDELGYTLDNPPLNCVFELWEMTHEKRAQAQNVS